MAAPISVEQPRLLVVEGVSEAHLFNALFAHMEEKDGVRIDDIQIINVGGRDNIRRDIQVIVNDRDFSMVSSIGIVRDADDNADDALRSVQGALRDVGLPAPSAPLSVVGDNPKVAVLITPYGRSSGVLEDVCLESVAGDPAMECVQDYFSCIESRLDAQPNNLSKAKAQAFLASRRSPGLQLGVAAHRGYWDFEHAAFEPLRRLVGMLL